jgi:hypothetical protein
VRSQGTRSLNVLPFLATGLSMPTVSYPAREVTASVMALSLAYEPRALALPSVLVEVLFRPADVSAHGRARSVLVAVSDATEDI